MSNNQMNGVGSSVQNEMTALHNPSEMRFEQDSLLVKQAFNPPSSVANQDIINEILNDALSIDNTFGSIDLNQLCEDVPITPEVTVQPTVTMHNTPPIMNGTVHFTDCKSFVEEGLGVPANGQWCSFAVQLRKVTNQFLRKHIRSVRVKTQTPKEYFSPTLKEEDMDLFGYSPMTDQLILVRCNHCSKTVKASRFNAHLGYCMKAQETSMESKGVVTEEKVNGKRKTAPVKVKEEINETTEASSSLTNISTKGGVTSKTTIIIPTSTTPSTTAESPSKKKKTSKSTKKEEKRKNKSEKKSKKDKKEKKSKTLSTTTTTTTIVEPPKDTLLPTETTDQKPTKPVKKPKTPEPALNVPTTGFIPLAGGNIIFHNNVFMNNVQLNQALNHSMMQAEVQSSVRSQSPAPDTKMASPYAVTVPIQIIPQQPPFTATQTAQSPPSPNPVSQGSPKIKKKVKKPKKEGNTPQQVFTQQQLQLQFQQYQQSLQRQFVNQPFTIQQLPNGVQQIYIHGLPQQILPGQPIQLSHQQPITIQALSPEQLQQIQQMSQVTTATTATIATPTTTTTPTATAPQLVSVPDGKGFAPYSPTAIPRQAFAAIPVPGPQQRLQFPNGPTAQVYHITANGLVPQAATKNHYFASNLSPQNLVETAKELLKTKQTTTTPKAVIAPTLPNQSSKQEWFRISKTASIIQAAQSQPTSTTTSPPNSSANNVNTTSTP